VSSLSLTDLTSDSSAGSVEEAMVRRVAQARKVAPSVLVRERAGDREE
jgi:hypothetical protein